MFLPCVSPPFFSEHLEAFRGAVLSIWFLPSVQPSCWVASKLSPSCCGRAPSGWVARVGGKIHSICVLCRVVLEGQNILSTCVYIYMYKHIFEFAWKDVFIGRCSDTQGELMTSQMIIWPFNGFGILGLHIRPCPCRLHRCEQGAAIDLKGYKWWILPLPILLEHTWTRSRKQKKQEYYKYD